MVRLLGFKLLLSLSVISFTPLPICAEGRIFLSQGEVAFSTPDEALKNLAPGSPVVIQRVVGGRRYDIGQGVLFRLREEHAAIRILSGSVKVGDRVVAGTGAVANEITPESPRDEPAQPALAPNPIPAGAESRDTRSRILVMGIIGAPSIVASAFDADFVYALLREQGIDPSSASGPAIVRDERRWTRAPSRREIRSRAKAFDAAIVIVPRYSAGAGGDSILVGVHAGATGERIYTSAMPVAPFPSLSFLPSGTRVGALEVVGRYEGLLPSPNRVGFEPDGTLVVFVGGNAFRLREGGAFYARSEEAGSFGRRAATRVGGRTYEVRCDDGTDSSATVVITRDDEVIFRSGSFPGLKGVAARNGRIAVLSETGIEVLRLSR